MRVRRVSGGKTLERSADAAIGPPSFGSNNCLGCAARAGAALQNNERSQVPASGYWHAQKTLWQMAPQRQPAPAADPSMVSRQPADVHATAAHELRILGR